MSKGTEESQVHDLEPCVDFKSAKTRRLHARVYADAKETELGAAQGRTCSTYQRDRSHDLHPGYWAQLARALDCFDSRRTSQGFAGRSLSRYSRSARCARRPESKAGPLQVWSKTAEGSRTGEEIALRIRNPQSAIRNRKGYAKKKSRIQTRSLTGSALQLDDGDQVHQLVDVAR